MTIPDSTLCAMPGCNAPKSAGWHMTVAECEARGGGADGKCGNPRDHHHFALQEDSALLASIVRFADQHREICPGAECNVSLFDLYRLLRRAGIAVPDKLIARFM